MQAIKELYELIDKAKNIKLNIAIFFVSTVFLLASKYTSIAIDGILLGTLQTLFLVTSIRLTTALIGVAFDLINSKKEQRLKNQKDAELAERLRNEKLLKLQTMREQFSDLDIHQLYIIQELRRQNSVTIQKGAPLFTLKEKGIIYTPAIGEKYESAAFTGDAKKIVNEEFWKKFGSVKEEAALRFFNGLSAKEMEHFKKFANNNVVDGKIYNRAPGQTSQHDYAKTFERYAKTTIFLQPQQGLKYTIDDSAKRALTRIS